MRRLSSLPLLTAALAAGALGASDDLRVTTSSDLFDGVCDLGAYELKPD
ncbi:MAG TPA: hypothetical protein VJA19_19975 [Pseudomonas sp.]|nr:hypothetical protein [Pseudomonas sp.]